MTQRVCSDQSEEERRTNDTGHSDNRIVPQKCTNLVHEIKLGNSSEGKARPTFGRCPELPRELSKPLTKLSMETQ